jgi:hypothetical protein
MQLGKAGAWREPAFSVCRKRERGGWCPFVIIFFSPSRRKWRNGGSTHAFYKPSPKNKKKE